VETVFVAMSGGIDSAYSACLLKKQGYNTVGFTFDLLPRGLRSESNPRVCCSAISMHRARRIADRLSIPHYVINMPEEFEHYVIRRFVDEYGKGRTPNPCVLCNRHIKFASFLEKALAMGADRVATGHYARVEETPQGPVLKKGKDRAKDQSYFLYPVPAADLPYLTFPLGSYTKEMVRREFAAHACGQAEMQESQDICFIPGNDYRRFIGQFIPPRRGQVVTVDGARVGYHDGVHLYTVGQRRGINIPCKEALYVIELRAEDNLLVVGPKDRLMQRRLIADEVNMLTSGLQGEARARVRYRQKEEPCSYAVRDGMLEVVFHRPVSAITPGQSVVLYDEETVLGGGTIKLTGDGADLNPRVIAG
jgi:tRNA-specific 2-thiouridylase